MKKQKTWSIKNTRPEEKYKSSEEYHTREVAENYAKSNPIKKTQEKMTKRAIELGNFKKNSLILDLGAGTGHSTKTLQEHGFKTKAIDSSKEMIKQAKKRGIKITKADMRKLPFKKQEFDGAISISALQWLLQGENAKRNIKQAAKELYRVLKNRARAVIQFYPKTEKQAIQTAKIFSKQGFKTELVTDYPNEPKKRKIYLVLEKQQKEDKKENKELFFSEIYEKSWKKKQEQKYKQLIPEIRQYLNSNMKVLDIGAGQAWIYKHFKKHGIEFKKITAVEPDKKMINKKNKKISYINTSFEKFNARQKYDLIIIFDSLHLIKKPEKISKFLKKEGLVLISIPLHYKNLLNQFKLNKQYKIIKKGVIGKEEKDEYLLVQFKKE